MNDAKVWKVTIRAEVAKSANTGADRSGPLQGAILPFHTGNDRFSSALGTISANTASRKFSEFMTNDFVQSGKFRVLDRSYWEESNLEEKIIRERSYGNQESIKLGQKLGADYMVVGDIEAFDITPIQQKMYGASTATYATQFDIHVRVIEVSTSDIIWSNDFSQTLDQNQLNRKLQELRKASPQKTDAQLTRDMQNHIYRTVSQSLVQDIINHITGSTAPNDNQAVTPAAPARDARPLTPGSSEKPLEWK